ncbi:MAG: hypothetical protein WCR78_03365 [Arcobacteraceae bacterium]
MDILEKAMVFLYIISIIVVSYPVFSFNENMKVWIEKIENSTEKGIFHIAQLSDKKALEAFSQFFLYIAIFSFILSILYSKIIGSTYTPLALTALVFFYFFVSVRSWSTRRDIIIKDELNRFKKDFIFMSKIGIGIFFTFLLFAYLNRENLPSSLFNINELMIFIPSILALILISVFTMSAVVSGSLLTFVFLPAVTTILYLKIVINTSKLLSKFDKIYLKNIFTVYFIIVSVGREVAKYF